MTFKIIVIKTQKWEKLFKLSKHNDSVKLHIIIVIVISCA